MQSNTANILKFLIIIISLSISVSASAAQLKWDASSGKVDGYKVYYGTNPSTPSNSINVGNATQYDIDKLALSENVQYYFCVSAYNVAGESPPCAPVAYTFKDSTPPSPPIGLVAE